MRILQLGVILFSRERYWRLRTLFNFTIKAFISSFAINALISAGVNRSDYFFSPDWLGSEGGVVTSDAAIYRALMLPTACHSALYDTIAHQVPWRLVVLLQLLNTAVVVGTLRRLLRARTGCSCCVSRRSSDDDRGQAEQPPSALCRAQTDAGHPPACRRTRRGGLCPGCSTTTRS